MTVAGTLTSVEGHVGDGESLQAFAGCQHDVPPAGPRRRFWGAGQRLNARDVTSIAAVITLQPITSRIAPESIMARSGIRPDP